RGDLFSLPPTAALLGLGLSSSDRRFFRLLGGPVLASLLLLAGVQPERSCPFECAFPLPNLAPGQRAVVVLFHLGKVRIRGIRRLSGGRRVVEVSDGGEGFGFLCPGLDSRHDLFRRCFLGVVGVRRLLLNRFFGLLAFIDGCLGRRFSSGEQI